MGIPNRLQSEKSPYLLQHANNPVDWYPWGEEAFRRAVDEDKPIFLSIGYSTCYWCHVMEREVFENADIAGRMNELFVNIKVDREERPDVDRIYMTALQSMTGSGGWPMSMFLTPDRRPFYGATYIPPVARYGRPGFPELIAQLAEAWRTRRAEVIEAGERIRDHLSGMVSAPGTATLPAEPVFAKAYASFAQLFDAERGGFGDAPKFPRPVVLNWLLRQGVRAGESHSSAMVKTTLDRMADGGMYDHVGGGFHRYSTDAEWHVPHFEKMLYDQALTVFAYIDAYLVSGDERYADVVRDILAYVDRSLRSPEGGFFAAEDAESVVDTGSGLKKEGAFYTWEKRAIEAVLTPTEAKLFCALYDVHEAGNVVNDPHGEFVGTNILRRTGSIPAIAAAEGLGEDEVHAAIVGARRKLRNARDNRPRPHLDDKIITSWNGMMITAFARASTALGQPAYAETAAQAAEFVQRHLMSGPRDLLRRYRDGEKRFQAGLEDHAWMARACLELYEATFEERYLMRAVEFTERAEELFHDREGGGFYDSVAEDASLIARMRESYDGAEPSGSAVLADVLVRLSEMLHDGRYRDLAEEIVRNFASVLNNAPHAAPHMLAAMDHLLGPSRQIVLVGDPADSSFQAMLSAVRGSFLPRTVVVAWNPEAPGPGPLRSADFVSGLTERNGRATLYVCRNFACELPVTDPASVRELLGR